MYNILNLKRDFIIEDEETGEVFHGKFSTPSVDIDIDIAVAKRLQGANLDSFPSASYGYIVACKTLDHVITDKPKSFSWKSFEEVPDYDFVINIFEKYSKLKSEFIESGKKNKNRTSTDSKSGTDSRSFSHSKIQNDNEQGIQHDSRSVPVSENVHRRGNIDTGEFRDLPFENQAVQQTQRDHGNRSENVHSSGNSNFPGGSGRVHRNGY
ncbi:MAG: hypothetical protein GW938_07575 [Leptospira sp.]|nr:hypothetical protein [Leptospira sp.]